MTAQDRTTKPAPGATLAAARIRDGIWTAELSGRAAPPELELWYGAEALPAPEMRADPAEPGLWHLRLELPRSILTDGMQALVLREGQTGETLAVISLILGPATEADLRGEMALLRAELDLLKQAVRRMQRG